MSTPEPTGERFPKTARLLRRRDFLRVGRKGRRFATRDLIVLVARTRCRWPRLGITVTRQAGKAVRRNKAKRLVREFFRTRRTTIAPGHDLVVIVKDASALRTLSDVESNFERLFRQAPFLSVRPDGAGGPGDAGRV